MIHELFRGLERTIHERLQIIEEFVRRDVIKTDESVRRDVTKSDEVISLERTQQHLLSRIEKLEGDIAEILSQTPQVLIPPHPLHGIEVIPKKEVVINEMNGSINEADRLLLNTDARKALEYEEASAWVSSGQEKEEEEVEEEEEEVVEEEVEEEVVEEEEEEQEDQEGSEELIEFEYKGKTFYRDNENNVYKIDEAGELIQEPIGVWSGEKIRF
jgi:hypothetical protein